MAPGHRIQVKCFAGKATSPYVPGYPVPAVPTPARQEEFRRPLDKMRNSAFLSVGALGLPGGTGYKTDTDCDTLFIPTLHLNYQKKKSNLLFIITFSLVHYIFLILTLILIFTLPYFFFSFSPFVPQISHVIFNSKNATFSKK